MRAGVAGEAHVAWSLLGALHLAALEFVDDARLAGERCKGAAERVVEIVPLGVEWCLVSYPLIKPHPIILLISENLTRVQSKSRSEPVEL